MSSALLTYDPQAQAKWEAQYARLPELWRQAVHEVRELGRMAPQTKAEYIGAIKGMRAARARERKTTADVARRIFNIIAGRRALNGQRPEKTPDPERFESLRDVRVYFMAEMKKIKERREARRTLAAVGLPVAPRGAEGMAFNDAKNPALAHMQVYLPDVADGALFDVVWEHGEKMLSVCLSGPPDGALSHGMIPKVATLLMQRMFAGDDPAQAQFFIHHPMGTGPRGSEQYWAYDLRADGLGRMNMMGRTLLPLVPHGVANRRVMEEAQAEPLLVDRNLPYAPGVEMLVRGQERRTARRKKVAQWRAFRPRARFGYQ